MNELKKANKHIAKFIDSGLGVEDGISRVKSDLNNAFHFSDSDKFTRQAIRECYRDFEDWLNALIISDPPPNGIAAFYFGLYESSGTIGLYITGARRWSLNDPDWACDNFYQPEHDHIELVLFREISKVYSEFNHAGLYLAIAMVTMLIREYTRTSIISLLDDKRRVLYIACGFDDGDLYNVGRLSEGGLQAPGGKWSLFR